MALVIDPVAVRRLDLVPVIDLEGGHSNAVLLVDDTLGCELIRNNFDALRRIMLVGDANTDVSRICVFQVGHQLLGSSWADDMKRRGTSTKRPAEPTCEPQVGESHCMVRMEMGQEQR